MAEIAIALAKTNPGRALELIRSIENDTPRTSGLRLVVEAIAQAQPQEAQNELTQGLADPDLLDQSLYDLASALEEADPGRAVQAARAISDRAKRSEILYYISPALARTDPNLALEVARSIENMEEPYRDWALSCLPAILAKSHPDLALEAARSVEEVGRRAMALTEAARPILNPDLGEPEAW